MRLTVVLPFYDEEALLGSMPGLLARIQSALKPHEVEFLAIDDGSSDQTAAGLAALDGVTVMTHEQNRGVGAAMNTGLFHARGDAAVVFDPDEPYPAETLGDLVAALDGADVATLSPYHPRGGVEGVGALRLLLSRGASFLYRWRLKSDLHTFTCAVRAYRLPQCRALLPAPDDFTAAAYLLAKALGNGLRVVEVPAVLKVRRTGRSKMRILRTIRSHLRLLRDLSMTPPTSKGPS